MGWVFWYKLQDNFSFSDGELAYTSFDCKTRIFKFQRGMETKFGQGELLHPTQKPVQLYRWLLSKFAKQGDTILDTHHGSGSNAIACLDMGFSITAYEIDEEYFNASVERIRLSQQQQKLFIGDSWKAAEGVTGQLLLQGETT